MKNINSGAISVRENNVQQTAEFLARDAKKGWGRVPQDRSAPCGGCKGAAASTACGGRAGDGNRRPCELPDPGDEYHVRPEIRAKMQNAIDQIFARCAPETQVEQILVSELLHRDFQKIAPGLIGHIDRLTRKDGPVFVTARGLPTPSDMLKAKVVSLAISSGLGEPFQYEQQNEGAVAAVLRPKPNAKPNSNSSAEPFGWHTDDSLLLHQYRTRYISLFGMMNESNVETGFAPLPKVLQLLDAQTISKLRQPAFQHRAGTSFNFTNEVWSGPRPVLWPDKMGRDCLTWTSYATRPADPMDGDASRALLLLKQAVNDSASPYVVAPGSLLVFDNDRGAHNRAAIAVGDRLVLRSYWRDSLHELRAATGHCGYVFDLMRLTQSL